MIGKIEQAYIDRLYTLMDATKKTDPDLAGALRWAIFTLEQGLPGRSAPHVLTKHDYLELWGYLDVLKTQYEAKAQGSASRNDDIGDKLAADHLRQIQAIKAMQTKVNEQAANMD